MIEGPILQEENFRHIRTGGEYTVLTGTHDDQGKPTPTMVKVGEHPDDSATEHPGWSPAIIYYDQNKSLTTFIRDEARFREKFERA